MRFLGLGDYEPSISLREDLGLSEFQIAILLLKLDGIGITLPESVITDIVDVGDLQHYCLHHVS